MKARATEVVRILIVDDNRDTREMYLQSLRLDGFNARTADNAMDALRVARTFQPSVVVTDLRLRGSIDGIELTKRLRADARTEEIRVIMLTGAALSNEREMAASSGVDLFVLKPCLPDALASNIRMVSQESL